MQRRLFSQGVLLLVVGIVSSLTFQQTRARSSVSAIDRTIEPVIVNGSQLAAFNGAPVGQIFVYAFTNGTWAQIRFQVDEKNADGAYVAVEDGQFDANDELVFMAKDGGDAIGPRTPPNNGQGVGATWYEVAASNPANRSSSYVYVVRSTDLSQTFTGDYVSFDATSHRITGESYRIGFASAASDPTRTKSYLDYLTLGSGANILDRSPKFRLCNRVCFYNEEVGQFDDEVIKDGPVRLIARNGRFLAYASMANVSINIPTTLNASIMRVSNDFNAAASGSTLYNQVSPAAGVTVDGQPESLPETPFSPWWQLSTSTGTIIQVLDVSPIGGTPSNYYLDSADQTDATDTGDKRHYGDIGFSIASPNETFTFKFALYMLSGRQPNIGSTYASYFSQPLSVTTAVRPLAGDDILFLPLITR